MLPASNQILPDDNIEDCSSTVSLTEKSTEESVKPKECNIELSTNGTQELVKDANMTSVKDNTIASDIVVTNASAPMAAKLSPQSLSHL